MRTLRRLVVVGLTAGALLAGSAVVAQIWMPASPWGGPTLAVAYSRSSPRILYLSTPAGRIYRSDDDAVSWRFVRRPPGFPAVDLIVDPQNPDVVLTRNQD